MTSSPETNDVQQSQSLQERQIEIAERRLELDESFPKKWGSIVFTAAATIIVAIISSAITLIQAGQTDRQRAKDFLEAKAQTEISNARTALEIYFKNLPHLKSDNERAVDHLALIAEVSALDSVRNVFYHMRDQIISSRRRNNPTISIAEAAEGLPTLQIERDYNPDNVTAYIQYPDGDKCFSYASQVAKSLRTIGMRVPGLEKITSNATPDNNEIRFYSTLQKSQMSELGAELKNATDLTFDAKVLRGNLPAGIVEIWIGKSCQ